MAKKISIVILLAMLVIMICGGCKSVKKNSSSTKLETDSTAKHSSETSKSTLNEVTNERNKNTFRGSSSSQSGSFDVEITFDTSSYSGYQPAGEKTDSTPAIRKPGIIKIGSDEQGNLSIDAGGRNIDKLKVKGQTSSNESNFQKVDSSSKSSGKEASEAKAKTLDSINLIKKLETENHSKEVRGFNWFSLLWWLIPLVTVYFTAKYLYKKKKLPLSLKIAKALLFV